LPRRKTVSAPITTTGTDSSSRQRRHSIALAIASPTPNTVEITQIRRGIRFAAIASVPLAVQSANVNQPSQYDHREDVGRISALA